MARVHHRVGIKGTPQEIFDSLIQPNRLTGWWATSATGEGVVGGQLDLAFAGLTHLVFDIVKLEENRSVEFRCVGEPEIWDGSRLAFELEQTEKQVYLTLTHSKDGVDDMDFLYFNTKWPLFLVSLKDFVETGKGKPFPDDVKINHDFS